MGAGRNGWRLVVALALLSMGAVGSAAAQTGRATIIDGDTLDVAGVRVRLWGIDAPESRQICLRVEVAYLCGQLATQHLRALVAGQEVTCVPRSRDRYGRTVALCRIADLDLGAAMVRDGWALAFVRYAADYVGVEEEAKVAGRGLWQGKFMAPWEWRAMARRGRDTGVNAHGDIQASPSAWLLPPAHSQRLQGQ